MKMGNRTAVHDSMWLRDDDIYGELSGQHSDLVLNLQGRAGLIGICYYEME